MISVLSELRKSFRIKLLRINPKNRLFYEIPSFCSLYISIISDLHCQNVTSQKMTWMFKRRLGSEIVCQVKRTNSLTIPSKPTYRSMIKMRNLTYNVMIFKEEVVKNYQL